MTSLPPLSLAQRLAAYIPATLVRQIMREGLPVPGQPHALQAATIFTDMSGFTAMSEELASDGPRGAEEVNRVLLLTFTGMIDIIHNFGGAISHFYGDAMSVYFTDNDGRAAHRALACGQQMQTLMRTSFIRVVTNRPPGKNPFFPLTMKVGVGYGRCQELIVGNAQTSLEFVLTGPAIDEAAEAEHQATAGQVIASRAVLQRAGLSHLISHDYNDLGQTAVPVPLASPILQWVDYDDTALQHLIHTIPPFIPATIHERLTLADATDSAEHRPVTSLFVQFEYAGDEDESSAIETAEMGRQLQDYYNWANEIVARFGSQNARVNRVLTGDKGNQLHIIFGAPIAPDAPDQAIRCALAMQRERPSFIVNQRIGLAAGKVFAGPVGATSRREYTVVGDVVNLSARLMQICENEATFTDQNTANRIRKNLEFEPLAPVKLKGKQEAITPYRVLREQAASHLQAYFGRWERPLVGRDVEQEKLQIGLNLALEGQGGLFTISGPRGVGKSHLLALGVKQWLDAGGSVLAGACQPQLVDVPFGPWRTIWQDFFGLQPGQEMDEQTAIISQITQRLVPDSAVDVGLWADVTGLPLPQSEPLQQLTAEARQARLYRLMRRCLQTAAADRPLFLILEDVHWSDQSSLDLIDELAQHFSDCHTYMALTYRENVDVPLQVLQQPAVMAVYLGDLAPVHARRMVQKLVGMTELPAAVEQHLGIRDRSGRESYVSPLFLEEAVNVMLSDGVFERTGQDRVRVNERRLSRMQVPDTIHGLLLARLDRLSPTSRDLLQIASVIGREFSVEPLNIITPSTSRDRIIEMMTQLTAEAMTQFIAADPDETYLFQQALTHEVAYESMPFARRQVLHADVADWLQQRYQDNLRPLYPVLAYHYTNAALHDKALYYALEAGHDARAIFANKEAVDLYNLAERHWQALGAGGAWQTAVDLYLARSETLLLLGDFNKATQDAEQARQIALDYADHSHRIHAHNVLAEITFRQARYDETLLLAQEGIMTADQAIPPDEVARAYQWLGRAANGKHNYELALFCLHQGERICQVTHNQKRLANILEGIAHVHFNQGDFPAALEVMQRSVGLSRNFSIPVNVASALNNIALMQSMLGQPQEALQTYNEAITLVQDASRNFLAHMLTNRAAVQAYLGYIVAAQKDFQEATNHFVAMDDAYGVAESYSLWGFEYSNVVQEWEAAAAQFAQAQRALDERPDAYPEQQVRVWLGQCQMALQQGDIERVVEWLDAADLLIADKNLVWWQSVAAYFRGKYHCYQSELEVAEACFRLGETAVAQGGSPDYLPLIFLELAALVTDHSRETYLVQSIEAAQKRSRHRDRLHCLQTAGQLLLASKNEAMREIGQAALKLARI